MLVQKLYVFTSGKNEQKGHLVGELQLDLQLVGLVAYVLERNRL